MNTATHDRLLQKEEGLKENVYEVLDEKRSAADRSVQRQEEAVQSGAYEEKIAPAMRSRLSKEWERRRETEALVEGLYERPYFAHVEAYNQADQDHRIQYFLSDCESLNESVPIRSGIDGMLLPFKNDRKRPISNALFRCYQSGHGKPVSYVANDIEQTLVPVLICDTDIKNRILREVTQYYPEEEDLLISFDELLDEKLQENRENPQLKNIIRTLQFQQFEIIERDQSESFVVQGCAGSGKTQCLIHRLFFLRGELSDAGWDKVLLVTPTNLFRAYSADLMRRYQLSDVDNYGITDFYRTILEAFDERFKDRQYVFQPSEEYLPNKYLKEVYSKERISDIESEIERAIDRYVTEACDTIGLYAPNNPDAETVRSIAKALDDRIVFYNEREKRLGEIEVYSQRRNRYWELHDQLDETEKKYVQCREEHDTTKRARKILLQNMRELQTAEKQRTEWIRQWQERVAKALSDLGDISTDPEIEEDSEKLKLYAGRYAVYSELTQGEFFNRFDAVLEELTKRTEAKKEKVQKLTAGNKPELILMALSKRIEEKQEQMIELESDIKNTKEAIEKLSEWLTATAGDSEDAERNVGALLSDIQQARYRLLRLESTVFEQEVWNALEPLKSECKIQTIETEELGEGKQRKSRILYKSDLLYYLMIYMQLHPDASLPDYRFICIDEGQDLHWADYDILKTLYPDAVFNVFGDTKQVLHTSCGISNWEEDTGIQTVYKLTTNYRNTAAIVDFCNQMFSSNMKYIGRVQRTAKPIVVKNPARAKRVLKDEEVVIIVRNLESYLEMCEEFGFDEDAYWFMDTNADDYSGYTKMCFSVYAAKGLEFSKVFVYSNNLTKNHKVVACTRAMEKLYYYENE